MKITVITGKKAAAYKPNLETMRDHVACTPSLLQRLGVCRKSSTVRISIDCQPIHFLILKQSSNMRSILNYFQHIARQIIHIYFQKIKYV